MNDPNIDGVFAAVGTDKTTFFASLFGSLLSLKWMARELPWTTKAFMVFGGLCTSVYGAPLIIEWFGIKGASGGAITFLLGVFGMSVLDVIIERTRSGQWIDVVFSEFKRRFFP